MADTKQLEIYADSIHDYFINNNLEYDLDDSNYEYDTGWKENLEYAILDGDVIEIPEIDREDSFKMAVELLQGGGGDYDDSMDGDWDSGMASAGWGTAEDYGDFGDMGESVMKDADNVIKMLKESLASAKAKKAGLVHVGFGNYAKEPGTPAQYKTVDGKLKKVTGGQKKQKTKATPTTSAPKKEEPKKEKPKSGIKNLRRVSGEKFTYEYEQDGRKYKFTLSKKERKELQGKASLMSIVKGRQKKKTEKEKTKQFKKGKHVVSTDKK